MARGDGKIASAVNKGVGIRERQIDRGAADEKVARSARGTAQLDATVRTDGQVVRERGEIAGHANAGAVLVHQQLDAIRIHAAERARVDRELRHRALARRGGTRARGVVEAVRAREHAQVAGKRIATAADEDVAIHQDAAREQVERALARGIEPVARHGELAAGDREAGEQPIGNRGPPGRQRDARRVDEAAAVARDAPGIRDDQLRGRAEDFLVTAQHRARVCAYDFVQDQVRRAVREVRVADGATAKERQGVRGAVVQDEAILADVVAVEAIVRNALRIRGRDVHDWRAIRALRQGGIRVGGDRRLLRQHDGLRPEGHVEGQERGKDARRAGFAAHRLTASLAKNS
jgi:hypothetical protein